MEQCKGRIDSVSDSFICLLDRLQHGWHVRGISVDSGLIGKGVRFRVANGKARTIINMEVSNGRSEGARGMGRNVVLVIEV